MLPQSLQIHLALMICSKTKTTNLAFHYGTYKKTLILQIFDLTNIMVVHIMNNEIGCFNQLVLREHKALYLKGALYPMSVGHSVV